MTSTPTVFAAFLVVLNTMWPSACAEEEAVDAFKAYLASPPCWSEILYSEATCSNTIIRSFQAASCGDSFFIRQLTGFENLELPISFTNRNKSSIYAGRLGDTLWVFGGYDLFLSVKPDPVHPDPPAVSVPNYRVMLSSVLNLGSQHLIPGSFVWTGNRFRAKANAFARQQGATEFEGEITIQHGVVSRMVVKGSGAWGYAYPSSPATNIPPGLPSEIMHLGSGFACESKLLINKMVRGEPADRPRLFDPLRRIDPAIAMRHVWSNGVQVLQETNNPLVTQLTVEELRPYAAAEKARKNRIRLGTFAAILILAMACSLWLLWKHPR